LVGFTHTPPHAISGSVHETQSPPEHTSFAVQSALEQHSWHCPVGPPQQIVPPEQAALVQVDPPPVQVSAVQPLPSSQSASSQQTRQSAPQSFGVAGRQTQLDALHADPALHASSHAPQCASVTVVSVSQSVASPSQSPKPVSQTGTPPSQCWFSPTAWSQPPQCWELVSVSTQPPLQSVSGWVQPSTQPAPSHSAVGFMHAVPGQVGPQAVGSVFAVSHPGAPVQSLWVAAHSHPDAPQTSFASQTVPQPRQLRTDDKSVSQPGASASQSA
jgi:hypothetical protein